jgi:Flp pilus assembly protein TadB
VSKERAQRRAEREREAAIRAAARAREEERRQRAQARRRTLTGWLPTPRRTPGLLARRRRREVTFTVCLLLVLNVLVWVVSPEWGLRILAAMVSLLVAPVVHTLLFRRR